jgi:hypothetical protein
LRRQDLDACFTVAMRLMKLVLRLLLILTLSGQVGVDAAEGDGELVIDMLLVVYTPELV